MSTINNREGLSEYIWNNRLTWIAISMMFLVLTLNLITFLLGKEWYFNYRFEKYLLYFSPLCLIYSIYKIIKTKFII